MEMITKKLGLKDIGIIYKDIRACIRHEKGAVTAAAKDILEKQYRKNV